MVKKDNRSLFGRLVGSSPQPVNTSAQDDYTDEDNNTEIEYDEALVEEADADVEIDDDTSAPSPVSVSRPRPAAPVANPTTQADSNWMSDFEGQLNIDMYQTKDNVIIKSTVAGVRAEDLDITVANDVVTIRGSRRREEEVQQDDYFYQECYWGSFSRSVIVPVDIDSEHIEADLKDGILTVVIPKAAKAKTKKVKVRGL